MCCLQCLGSGSGSMGSARFWLPLAKICGSMDQDSRGKISTKNCKKHFFLLKPKSLTFQKRKIIKISWFKKFWDKNMQKNKTKI